MPEIYHGNLARVRQADAEHERYMQFMAQSIGCSRDGLRQAMKAASPAKLKKITLEYEASKTAAQ